MFIIMEFIHIVQWLLYVLFGSFLSVFVSVYVSLSLPLSFSLSSTIRLKETVYKLCFCSISVKTLFGMKENLEHFANSTTMHGASRVILSKSPLQRWIWLAVFLSAWTMFITQTWLVCQNYLTYPTKINVEINYGNVAFPAITLCNMRGLDFYATHKLENHYERVWQNETVPVDQSDKFLTAFTRYVDYAQRKLDVSEDLDSDRIILSKTVLASNIRYDLLANKSISKEEFFVSCKFRGKDCEEASLAENYDHYYFRCFRYTPPLKGNLKEGAENGWSAIVLTGSGMLVNESQLIEGNFRYIPGLYEKNSPLSGSDGVRVVLHSPGVWPISVDEGFDVPPGYSVSLAFKPRVFIRADPPYGTCFHENPFYDGINMSSPEIQINKQIYREIECRKMCVQQRVIETCGCYEPSLPGLPLLHCEEYEADKNTNTFVSNCTYRRHLGDPRMIISICGYAGDVRCPDGRDCEGDVFRKQLNETSCVRSVKEDDISPDKCTCSPPCNEVEYDVGYSFSKWPAKGSDADEVLHEILVVSLIQYLKHEDSRCDGIFQAWHSTLGKPNAQINMNNFQLRHLAYSSIEINPTHQYMTFPGRFD